MSEIGLSQKDADAARPVLHVVCVTVRAVGRGRGFQSGNMQTCRENTLGSARTRGRYQTESFYRVQSLISDTGLVSCSRSCSSWVLLQPTVCSAA